MEILIEGSHLQFDRTIRSLREQDLDHPKWRPRFAWLFGCALWLDVPIKKHYPTPTGRASKFQKHPKADGKPLIWKFENEMEAEKSVEIAPHHRLLISC